MATQVKRRAVIGAAAMIVLASPGAQAADGTIGVPARQDQAITFLNPGDSVVGMFAELTATADSGLPVTFTASSSCRIGEDEGVPVAIAISAGACSVTAHQGGDDTWNAAPDVAQTFTFERSGTKLGIGADGGWVHTPGSAITVLVHVDGLNGSDPVPSGTVDVVLMGDDVPADLRDLATVTLDAHGSAEIVIPAAQTKRLTKGHYGFGGNYQGDENFRASYAEFSPLELFSRTVVTASYSPQTGITRGDRVTFRAHVAPVDPSMGAPVTGTMEFAWGPLDGIDVDIDARGNAVGFTDELPGGTIQVIAQYLPDNEEYGTSWVTMNLTVARQQQTITFPAQRDRRVNEVFAPDATASSGLDVAFVARTPKVCDVDWDQDYAFFVTPLAPGTCTLVAEQTGNESYLPANSVTRSFTVGGPPRPGPSPIGGGGSAHVDAGPLGGPVNGVVLTTATSPQSVRAIRVARPVTLQASRAPVAHVVVGQAARITVPGLPPGSTNLVRVAMGRSWTTLGRVVADAAGAVTLPTIDVVKPGTYAVRVVTEGKPPRYLTLHAVARASSPVTG